MAVLKRGLHSRAKGPVMNNEDWWRLVFDDETGRLYVEHEWHHVDVQGNGAAREGTEEIEIADFLNEGGQGEGHRELRGIIESVFAEKS